MKGRLGIRAQQPCLVEGPVRASRLLSEMPRYYRFGCLARSAPALRSLVTRYCPRNLLRRPAYDVGKAHAVRRIADALVRDDHSQAGVGLAGEANGPRHPFGGAERPRRGFAAVGGPFVAPVEPHHVAAAHFELR